MSDSPEGELILTRMLFSEPAGSKITVVGSLPLLDMACNINGRNVIDSCKKINHLLGFFPTDVVELDIGLAPPFIQKLDR
jgi:hypothetical protein